MPLRPLLCPQLEYALGAPERRIAGVDEVGVGSLAGPLVAAAAVLPLDLLARGYPGWWYLVRDSKKASWKQRERCIEHLLEIGTRLGFGIVWPEEIDEIGALAARESAMEQALLDLDEPDAAIIVDGEDMDAERLSRGRTSALFLIKADTISPSVAAASICAKVLHDSYMEQLHVIYPEYGWNQNKGYGSVTHLEAINTIGPVPFVHRYSFNPVKRLRAA